jgi:hypothetical protein
MNIKGRSETMSLLFCTLSCGLSAATRPELQAQAVTALRMGDGTFTNIQPYHGFLNGITYRYGRALPPTPDQVNNWSWEEDQQRWRQIGPPLSEYFLPVAPFVTPAPSQKEGDSLRPFIGGMLAGAIICLFAWHNHKSSAAPAN